MEKKEREEQKQELRRTFIRRSFLRWVDELKPDLVSRKVLGILTEKYANEDVNALFSKMKQLENHEHYRLCTIFKSMFDSMKINDEYLRWLKNNA